MLHVAGTAAEKSRGLHLAIADGMELSQSSWVVLGELISHRVQLQSNRQAQRIGHQPGCAVPQRRRGNRGCRSLQNASSRNEIHFDCPPWAPWAEKPAPGAAYPLIV